jgi:hypothetical protein
MKKIILTMFLFIGMQLIAEEIKFPACDERKLDSLTKILVCDKEQYLVEYTYGSSTSSINVSKITLIRDGKHVVIKE